jgi:hypothetical protein
MLTQDLPVQKRAPLLAILTQWPSVSRSRYFCITEMNYQITRRDMATVRRGQKEANQVVAIQTFASARPCTGVLRCACEVLEIDCCSKGRMRSNNEFPPRLRPEWEWFSVDLRAPLSDLHSAVFWMAKHYNSQGPGNRQSEEIWVHLLSLKNGGAHKRERELFPLRYSE